MSTFYIGNEFFDALKNNNYKIVDEGVKEIEEKLAALWNSGQSMEAGDLLALSYQRLKRARRDIKDWQASIVYQIGMLDGIISTYDSLFQMEKEQFAINQYMKQILRNSGPVSRKIFARLSQLNDRHEWIGHKQLAKDVGTSESSLSNIMKRLVLSNAVESERIGKTINYRITPAGNRYYLEKCTKQRPEAMLDIILEGMSELCQKVDQISVSFEEKTNNNSTIMDVNSLIKILEIAQKLEKTPRKELSENTAELSTNPQILRMSKHEKAVLAANNYTDPMSA